MLFQEFTQTVEAQVKELAGEQAEVSLSCVRKNNGVGLTAIHIREKGSNIYPTIYLDDYYAYYKDGMSLEKIVSDIMKLNKEKKLKSNFTVTDFSELDKVRKTICFKLIHAEKNKELLEDVPHLSFLDLAIVFYCSVEMEEYGKGTILIHNSHLSLWNITKEELVRIAKINTPKLLPCRIRSMESVLKEMMSEALFAKEVAGADSLPLFVMTNSEGCFGASVILYPDVLADFAGYCNCNLMIIPSSVHEVLVVPAIGSMGAEDYNEMIQDTNQNHVAQVDVLSDHVYYFDRKSGEITIPSACS
ncbi:MAG: hypothetical protein E7294_04180 [Lachnospiraceae bacterium]|nr:hypothetical protein [Lachnospiraceae bacterium]